MIDTMMHSLKEVMKSVIRSATTGLSGSKIGRFFLDEVVTDAMQRTHNVRHGGVSLDFTVPNMLNHFRAETFSSKEPETLEWIEALPEGSVLWDIGANVGLYSCYAAKKRHCRVYAFEPSVFNLELLARNIHVNRLVDYVTIVPLPLSDGVRESTLNMTSTDWGGALSSFGELYGDDGKMMKKVFDFQTLGISMDAVVDMLEIPLPMNIKMDVDGIEHLILKSGKNILQQVQSVIIEVNEDFAEQDAKVSQHLSDAGLQLIDKKHSAMFEGSARFGRSYNQIWARL